MTTSSTDDWSLMLPFDPAARRNRAHDPDRSDSAPAPAQQSTTRPPAALLDDARDRFDAIVRRAPVTPVRRFYRAGRLDGYMQIVRQRAR